MRGFHSTCLASAACCADSRCQQRHVFERSSPYIGGRQIECVCVLTRACGIRGHEDMHRLF